MSLITATYNNSFSICECVCACVLVYVYVCVCVCVVCVCVCVCVCESIYQGNTNGKKWINIERFHRKLDS